MNNILSDRPDWVCWRYGGYDDDGGGHDWLLCPECLEGYEKWLEERYLR